MAELDRELDREPSDNTEAACPNSTEQDLLN